MAKDILIIDTKKALAYHCSKTDAAKIIGITRKTILEWEKAHKSEPEKKIKEKKGFLIIFDYEEIKIARGFNLKSKS